MNACRERALIAGALSLLVPGLGQIYNRHILKAVLVFFTAFLVIPYIYGVIDAYVWGRRHGRVLDALQPRALLAPGLPALEGVAGPYAPPNPPPFGPAPARPSAPTGFKIDKVDMELALLRAAREHGGSLSVTEGVMATGRSFKDVEKKLDTMAGSGYVDITNRPDSGVVVYRFTQL